MPPRDRTDQQIFEKLQAAEGVARRLRGLTGSLGPDFVSTQFYTRIRVKSYDSIVKKIYARRREEKQELYSFQDVLDVVGFRIVTLYDDDIQKAVDHLLRIVGASKGFDQPLFRPIRDTDSTIWAYIREATFFLRRSFAEEKDVYQTCYEEIIRRIKQDIVDGSLLEDTIKRFKVHSPEGEGYSSIHFVLNATSTKANEETDIPIEVQIRTAAEDIWGEINHQLFYKAKDLYVWTPDLQRLYTEMVEDSRRIKTTVDQLREPITTFWRHYIEATRRINNFRNPTTTYHRSLVVTLFYAISPDYFTAADEHLRAYDEKLKELSEPENAVAAAQVLAECLGIVMQVREAFAASLESVAERARNESDGSGKSVLAKNALENDAVVLKQRQHLCDLEAARLKALGVVRFRHLIEGAPREISHDKDEYKKEIEKVFDMMCGFRNSWELKIRPVAMMSYWKYIIALEIDHGLAMHHLNLALEELDQDSSLPAWSIYRILILRSVAAESYEDARKLVHANGYRPTREIWWRSQLAIDLRIMLGRAMKLAVQAYQLHVAPDVRRGDLVFGFEKHEDIRDADVIVNISSLYFALFDHPDYQSLGTTPDFLRARVLEIRAFLIDLKSTEEEVTRRLKRIDKLLERLDRPISS